MKIILERIFIIVLLWAMLTGGAVFVCSSGDGRIFLPGGNRRPVAEDSFLQTDVETSIRSAMQASDPDGDDLTYRVTSGPDVGSLNSIDADTGRFTYVPTAVGTDSFTFKANDGSLDSNTGTVSILVTSGAVGVQTTGLKMVVPNVSRTDGLTFLWDSPSGIVERKTVSGAGPAQGLLRGVDRLAADPWQAGRLLALMKDGRLLTSPDDGLDWQLAGRLKGQVETGGIAYSDNRILIAIDSTDCGGGTGRGLFMPVEGDAGPIDVEFSCGHSPLLDTLDGAYIIRDTWLHSVSDDEELLGPGVVAITTDHWQQKRLVAVTKNGSGRFLVQVSEDGGQTWRITNRAELPQPVSRGDIGRLVFDPEKDGAVFVSVWNGDGSTSVYRSGSEQAPWNFVGSLGDGKAELIYCAYRTVCLLSADGTRLSRFSDTADEG